MPYEFSPRAREVLADVVAYMDDHVYPNEEQFAEEAAACGTGDPPLLDKLKAVARERGLWNLFLPHLAPGAPGTKLTNLDYAPVSEQVGKVVFASELLNCAAPDTGNMEILNLYGSERVKEQWLGRCWRVRFAPGSR
jgi:acyl-CoA dehydrogenase